eukprot:TRINITY_DN3181_c0_g1_i1.p1 TRINITY_DN3181_c0_g1~~TRINITY_DN3181_c0_g1_i1.p1  ORF type:complete len:706 (-),score=179.55 TRINITY_DN3181_c0_g1_i1:188-2305(-)
MRVSVWLCAASTNGSNSHFRSIIRKGRWDLPSSSSSSSSSSSRLAGPTFEPHITLFTFQKDFNKSDDVTKLINATKSLSAKFKLFPIAFEGVRKGKSYFQSVLLEVASKGNEQLFALRKAAEEIYSAIEEPGPNAPVYYPHLSLHYGEEEELKDLIFKSLETELSSEKLKGLSVFEATEIALVRTDNEVTEWYSLGSSPLGGASNHNNTPVFLRQAMYIGGQWVDAKSAKKIPIVNPATKEVYSYVPAAQKEDVDLAVQHAVDAFPSWSSTTGAQRASFLRAIAAEIRANQDELSVIETLNNGKPLREAIEDVRDSASCFEYYATLADELDTNREKQITLPDDTEGTFTIKSRKEPVGVCGLIIPWNYPILMAAWKLAPSLAAGCTLVLKPSELTPFTSLELAAICDKVKLPPGVVNVITGYGPEAGAPLSNHPDIAKVAFTGSVATGRKVYQSAAESIKRVTLELGGKSPIVVFDDVDIDKTVEWLMVGIFFNQGQVCSATSRAIIHEGVADKIIARLVEESNKIVLGDGLDPSTIMGPIVNEAQYNKVLDYIKKGKAEGAKLVCGDGALENSKGFFVPPTIFTNVSEDSTIWKEEIFGPVLCIKTFKDENEAIRLANNTTFGLGAGVISKDKERCRRVSEKLQAGIVWINCSQPTFVQAPWGGMKQSGIGRELGPWGIENYLETKQITTYESDEAYGWFIKDE